jgi:hypothetical protein
MTLTFSTGIGNSTIMLPRSKNDVSNENENEKGAACFKVVDGAFDDMSGGDVSTDVGAEQPVSNAALDGGGGECWSRVD